MSNSEIQALEQRVGELMQELNALRKATRGEKVENYSFATLEGRTTLRELFGEREKLLAIHNMGQGCRYCTLWADGFNGFLPHLESVLSVVLLSKDPPETQRRFANSRAWRFRLASHAGGRYIQEQTVLDGADNMPGAVVYELQGDDIYRKSECVFGPGDLYCSMWSLLGLAGLGADDWTPQFRYWQRPPTLDDGGAGVVD